jgi:peptide chain release factor 3
LTDKNFFSLSSILLEQCIGKELAAQIRQELDFIINIYPQFDNKKFLRGISTPVFFGSALKNFGIDHLLTGFIKWAPSPLYRQSNIRRVNPQEKKFTGFIFKIQANMDLKHRDRIAFMRIVSGQYTKGMKLRHVRTKKDIIISDAFSFLAGDRILINKAYPGDVIGLHNHGTIKIGDTFTEGEEIKFIGIPTFAPEIFRRIYLKNPLKQKQLMKGLIQLSEEGAVQVFRPVLNNNIILGTIGTLQFDVVIARLRMEYNIDAIYEKVNIASARWIRSKNNHVFDNFKKNNNSYLAYDACNTLIYLAPSLANLNIAMIQYTDIFFDKVREQ